jgi:UDP-2,3-diacylglucosamine pyrophosphatase LpxH
MSDVKRAIEILSRHTDKDAAWFEIHEALPHIPTKGALRNKFARAGLRSPTTYLRGGTAEIPIDLAPPEEPSVVVEDDPPTQPSGRAPHAGPSIAKAPSPTIRALMDALKREPRTVEDLADALDLSPRRTRALVDEAKSAGYRVQLDGAHVGRPPSEPSLTEHPIAVPAAGAWRIFAALGDVHVGSKYFRRESLLDFIRIAYARGVRTFLQVGDLLDGGYRFLFWEQHQRGFDEQVAEAIRVLPQLPGAVYHFIEGNHDQSLGDTSGLNVGEAIVNAFRAAGRHDIIYHGSRGAYVRLLGTGDSRGLLAQLWHPRGAANGVYGAAYPLIRHVERYAPGQKPDCLLAGHHHDSIYFQKRGVHAFACGCWQGGQSAFGKSIGGAPAIGSWIVEYALTEGGTVRSMRKEWLAYPESETVRDVALG